MGMLMTITLISSGMVNNLQRDWWANADSLV